MIAIASFLKDVQAKVDLTVGKYDHGSEDFLNFRIGFTSVLLYKI